MTKLIQSGVVGLRSCTEDICSQGQETCSMVSNMYVHFYQIKTDWGILKQHNQQVSVGPLR